MRNGSRNTARYRREHQCSVWHTEVQLFPEGDGEPVIRIEEKLCGAELEDHEADVDSREHPEGDIR
jgi:hypothetical protein